jgi:hypothetical protein
VQDRTLQIRDTGESPGRDLSLRSSSLDFGRGGCTSEKLEKEINMLHKISMILILFATTACMKVKKKGDEAPEPQATESSVEKGFDYHYEFTGGHTQVVFKLPTEWSSSIVIGKSKGVEKIFQREVLTENQTWKDDFVDNAKINYQFFQKIGNQLVLAQEVEVLPAFDLNLSQDFKLNEIYGLGAKVQKIYFHRLRLEKGAKVFIGDFKGKIQIENLISENGVLQTFPVEAKAASGNGRSVGDFSVEIQAGEGHLELNLFAESGADGLPGSDPDSKLNGTAGAEGKPAQFSQVAGDGIIGAFKCSQPPQNGADGGKGKPGYPGQNGGHGGSVHSADVASPASIEVKENKVAGLKGVGGQGGAGGAGGPGGRGGDGGLRDLYRVLKFNPDQLHAGFQVHLPCPAAKSGNTGAQGETGARGRDGHDGVVF